MDEILFIKVEVEPKFSEGDAGWKEYLQNNLRGDVAARNGAPVGSYTILVTFTVDREGNIKDVFSDSGNPGYGMLLEAIRVIKNSPKWIAGMQNGHIVNCRKIQPITFQVSKN